MELFSADGPSDEHLSGVKAFCQTFGLLTYSEHLSITDGIFFLPPFNECSLEIAIRNIRRAQDRIGVPLLIENVACNILRAGGTMSEAEFLSRVCEGADCYLLLDVANIYVNSVNLKFDPKEFLKKLPHDRVVQIHYCGVLHSHSGEVLDSHSETTQHEVWDLLDWSLRHTSAEGLILERDSNFGNFSKIGWELEFARELFRRRNGTSLRPIVTPRKQFLAQPSDLAIISATHGYRRVEKVVRRILLEREFSELYFANPELALSSSGIDELERSEIEQLDIGQLRKFRRKFEELSEYRASNNRRARDKDILELMHSAQNVFLPSTAVTRR